MLYFRAGRDVPGGGTITRRQRDDKKYILLFLNYSYATIGVPSVYKGALNRMSLCTLMVSKVSCTFCKLSFILRRLQALLRTLCLIPE